MKLFFSVAVCLMPALLLKAGESPGKCPDEKIPANAQGIRRAKAGRTPAPVSGSNFEKGNFDLATGSSSRNKEFGILAWDGKVKFRIGNILNVSLTYN